MSTIAPASSTISPTPWSIERTNANGWKGISIKDANGHAIAYMVMQPGRDNEMANAKAIVATMAFAFAISLSRPGCITM